MRNVRMKKSDLLDAVIKNKEDHKVLYEEALEAYEKNATELLEDRLAKAKDGIFELHFGLVRPEDHTEDYVRTISMLEYELGEEIELTAQEFANYVEDKWGWQEAFATSYASNTGKAYFMEKAALPPQV